ncbi:putative ferric-chelate reductase 1 [Carex littledalei]|uniref:Putative ferric-chelate reductase 1 n=1 Tax=Carex littledalei TaxID=544730 RepID=A0A833R3Q0_9POAL|nr:putative ferric-chelate reductase 1 [Carex littledalei]
MTGNSVMAGWISSNGGTGVVKQYYLGGYSSGSCPPDQGSLPLVANTSVIVSQSSQLYLAFQLNTTMPQWSHLIYAVGPSGSLPSNNYLPEHSSKASSSVEYSAGTVSGAGSGSSDKARWHGFLVALGWGILMPVGIMMARYFKKYDPFWFYAHISIQGAGFVLGLVGIIIGFSLNDDGVDNIDVHKAIGIIILVFGALQIKAFFIRPVKTSKIRRYWNWYHHNIGRAAVILSIVNIFIGLDIASESTGWSVGYGIFLALWGLSCIFLEVKLWMAGRDH